jgi:predicted hotdog family 3-hydroxylacyl-ACP dehydratase
MLVQGDQILQLIPQRPPMVMVDKLISIEEKTTTAGLTVLPENIFVMDGLFREPGLIEHIAQSAALGVGYYYRSRNEEVPTGFIGAIKNLVINFLPEAHCELITEITVEHEVLNATLIRGKVFLKEKLVAECEMKIFLNVKMP